MKSLRAVALTGVLAWVAFTSSLVTAAAIQETFEGAIDTWQVDRDTAGGGIVAQSTVRADSGASSARLSTSSSDGIAQIRGSFSDPAGAHAWEEWPGTWHWQRAD